MGKSYPLSQLAHEGVELCSLGVSQVRVTESLSVDKHITSLEVAAVGDGSTGLVVQDDNTHIDLDPDMWGVWEVCQEEEQVLRVQGRLTKCIAFWEHELKAPSPVLECIRVGHKLPLLSVSGVYYNCNANSALEENEFVKTALEELVQNCCICKVDRRLHVCSPLCSGCQ